MGREALASGAASAGVPFGQFVAFGASYDDSGQFPDLELGGTTGLRFTNIDPATGLRGLSMPEWLALDLGLGRMNPSTPLLVFGARTDTVATDNLNFAVGGYRSEEVLASVVGNSVVSAGGFRVEQPGFLARVASGALAVGPDTLYYALIAGNDIRDVDDPEQTADVSAAIAEALVDAGARYIVLPTLPKLGNFSEAVNLSADGRTQLAADRTAAAIAYNAAFAERLNAIDGNFIRVDVLRLFDEVLADPVGFGYPADLDQARVCFSAGEAGGIDCVEPAGRGKASGGDPDQFVFQDGLHPTQAAARAAADLMESVIRAPGLAALLPEAVLADTRGYLRTVEEHLVQNRWTQGAQAAQLFVAGGELGCGGPHPRRQRGRGRALVARRGAGLAAGRDRRRCWRLRQRRPHRLAVRRLPLWRLVRRCGAERRTQRARRHRARVRCWQRAAAARVG